MKTCFLIYLLGMAALAGLEPAAGNAAGTTPTTPQGAAHTSTSQAAPAGLDCKTQGRCQDIARH
jgi:hypothetical protein